MFFDLKNDHLVVVVVNTHRCQTVYGESFIEHLRDATISIQMSAADDFLIAVPEKLLGS